MPGCTTWLGRCIDVMVEVSVALVRQALCGYGGDTGAVSSQVSAAVGSVNAEGLNNRISIGQVPQTTGRGTAENGTGCGRGLAVGRQGTSTGMGPCRTLTRLATQPLCTVDRTSPAPRGRLVQVTRRIHQTLIFRLLAAGTPSLGQAMSPPPRHGGIAMTLRHYVRGVTVTGGAT
ncbi:hypothetical protein E2C01_085859 [Portunus trituberculatus]|uniref:Uncharacterized protein n=1 Tax=Portunus trituberculatus TaxID=210409 RepID=A0A5B7JA05_PORTR|nr:hypothetical protein [Portunus trituberculatus]